MLSDAARKMKRIEIIDQKVPGQKDIFALVLSGVPGQMTRCPCGFGAYGRVRLCPPLPCNDQYRYTGALQPSSELFNVNLIHQMAARRVDATRLRRAVYTSPGSLLVAVLLFRAGVETNPGPCNQPRRLHSSLVLGC